MTKTNKMHRVAAAVTAGMMIGEAGSAQAAGGNATFSTIADNIVTSTASLPSLISTVAYIGGIGLGVAGVFKLKQHVDNPGQTPMKDGLVRLGAGGGLLALPYVTTAMMGSINNGTNTGVTEGTFASPALQGAGG